MVLTSLHFILGLRRKADELRRNAKKDTEDSDKAEEMRTEANKLMKEASELVEGPELTTYVVRSFYFFSLLPYPHLDFSNVISRYENGFPTIIMRLPMP